MQRMRAFSIVLFSATLSSFACSSSSSSPQSSTPATGGDTQNSGGSVNDTGGGGGPVAGSGGQNTPGSGGNSAGGQTPPASGGNVTGGLPASGGNASGGQIPPVSGGKATGGLPGSGGKPAGGSIVTGGVVTGGVVTGGVVTGGTPGGGGGVVQIQPGNRVRQIIPLDRSWLFNKGDATGADQATFADSAWKPVNLPHDWAVEGPFAQDNPTTGRGGFAPSGIGWYRNHFTLPGTVASGQQVYIEFDGVMGNSTVYINGTQLGNHPYGYVSFRYDMTKSVKFGSENVLAVKTDTSIQPASRFYAGAGIYRRARIIATDPVHVDQYATYVNAPSPTAASATVHVTTSVVNSGASSQSVSIQGIVSDASGTALAPVTAAAQDVAAGASASFTFDVPVTSPKLWDLATPNMYQLLTNVQVGGKTVDDDVTLFGIRDLKFSTGMTLNGKSLKFQGVANHQDYHGLGLAAPARAMQRRLAQLKAIGVNAIRTAHDPPSPEFLDLTDRMGFLVLDEFTDVWQNHKYSDVGDYAAYFSKPSTTPTGMPPLPSSATGKSWWEVDFTGFIMRDRNHPSVALYSTGNEIHDSLTSRTPILTEMVKIVHQLDSSHLVTQALLDPQNGDVGGSTNSLLDVWGDNYNVDACIQAEANVVTKSGLITEVGEETTTWDKVTANAGLTGSFQWTGVDYMGEITSTSGWPKIGGGGGLVDSLGAVRANGYSWAKIWGASQTSAPPSGAAAGKVVLIADHPTLLNDVDDVSFVKAVVSTDTTVTFKITGPGTIIAVDSGSMQQESFRGSTRSTTGGVAYAIVQATGAGSITVTASATGLTDGTATITATEGTWVPCSGTCD
jgi:beta-galactosidase